MVFGFVGAYLIATTAWRYFADGITTGAPYTLLVGVMSFLVISYQKLTYVSLPGIIKETRTWFFHHREILRWSDIKFVSIMYRGDLAMVFLERDILGWKVLFLKEQIPKLKELFEEHIPEVEINEINERKK